MSKRDIAEKKEIHSERQSNCQVGSDYNLVEYTDTYMNPMYAQFRVDTDVTEDLD